MRLLSVSFIFVSILLSESVQARPPYGMAGCGLGSLLFTPSQSQIFAASTNGLSGIRYSAMTSGTSNCSIEDVSRREIDQEVFIFENYNDLAKEMARGGGPASAVLAELMGCENADLPAFNQLLQREYRSILAAPGAVAALDSLRSKLLHDSRLSAGCRFVAAARSVGGVQ
jgi:hypothetical protein